jgi:hypothetical protein
VIIVWHRKRKSLMMLIEIDYFHTQKNVSG